MSNYTEILDKALAQSETYVEPLVRANKLAVANVERVIELQLKALQKYVDLGIAQLKAAAEIDSPKALQAYFGKQIEVANTFRQQLLDDVKAWTELSTDLKDEFTKLAEDNVKEFKAAAAKATSTRKAA